jgi:hypothetical protein
MRRNAPLGAAPRRAYCQMQGILGGGASQLQWEGEPVRKFLTSGRRRYALLLLLGAGSLVIMGNTCAPTKPPAPTGLSIAPASADFGDQQIGTFTPPADLETFTVTNNGPDKSGTLTFAFQNFNPDNFAANVAGCSGKELNAGETCQVSAGFAPLAPAGKKQTDLVVSTNIAADGTAAATLSGNAIP